MRTLTILAILALLIPLGCKGTDNRIKNFRIEGTYLNDKLSGSDPFNWANGSHRTGAEGLEGSHLALLGGGEVYQFEGDESDSARVRVDFLGGVAAILPNGGNYVGRSTAKWVDKDDDSFALGLTCNIDLVYEDPDWFISPLFSIGGGVYHTRHKWDGFSTNYLLQFRPRVGFEIPTDRISEGSRLQVLYGIDHYSNGRGRVRNSNDGRNTDAITINFTLPF